MNRLLALIRLRCLLGFRQFRGGAKWTNRVVSALLTGLGAATSLVMGVGFGLLVYHARAAGDRYLLEVAWQVALWSCAFFGLFLPLLRGGTGSGLEPEQLLVYPLGRMKLSVFFLSAAFVGGSQLFYYPTLIAAAAATMIPTGPGWFSDLLVLLLFVVVVVVWSNTLSQAVRVLMARRRLRELIVLGAMVLLILACLLPALFDRLRSTAGGVEKVAEVGDLFAPVVRAAAVLPPSIAVQSLCPPDGDTAVGSGQAVIYLLLWAAAGLVLGDRLFLRERNSFAVSRVKPAPPAGQAREIPLRAVGRAERLIRFLPSETRAVALKDLRYLLRSVLGRFSLLMAPVLVLMFVFIFSEVLRRPLPGIDPERVLFFSTMIYIAFLSNNFLNNAFAWEGSGAQHYFLCPVKLRHVLLGKNLAVWVFNIMLFLVSVVTWGVVSPLPSPGTLLAGFFVFSSALLLMALGGNVVSIYYPVPRNPAAFLASPSQVGVLVGILALLASVLLCGLTLLLTSLLGLGSWQPLFMGFLLAVLALLHRQMLGITARIWADRNELFLQSVK